MRTLRISSLDDPRLDPYTRLTNHQLRSEAAGAPALMVLESLSVIEVALEQGLELVSLLIDERHLERLEARLPGLLALDVPVFLMERQQLSQLTGFNVTRGYLALARRPALLSVAEALEGAAHVCVLENLVDTTNVGAVFRSAAALGADAVLFSPRCADPLERRAVRVSMGTVFQTRWARVPADVWPEGLAAELHRRGFDIVALALGEGSVPLDSVPGAPRRALLFGNEGYGLSSEALASADRLVRIPMANGVDSLNVAASSAVAFWELFRSR